LHELALRGWVRGEKDKYQITVEGQIIREEAEELTDQYFFAS
jgi:hypothetical protein